MGGYYKLKTPYFTPHMIERTIKRIFIEEEEDRKKATDAFDFFMDLAKQNPQNDKAIDGAIKFFQQTLKVKEKTSKIIELYLKAKLTEGKKSDLKNPKTREGMLDFFNIRDFEDNEES